MVIQSDDLMLSTLLVAPTSRSAAPSSFRPTIDVGGEHTHVLVEQTAAVDPTRLGAFISHLGHDDMSAIDDALRLVLQLD